MGGRRGGSKQPPVVKDNWSLTGPRGQYGLGEGVSGPPGVTNGAWLPGSQYGGPAPGGQPPMGGQRMGKTPARGGQFNQDQQPGGVRIGKTPKSGMPNPGIFPQPKIPNGAPNATWQMGMPEDRLRGETLDPAKMQAQQDMMGQMANALRMGGQ